MLNSRTFFLDFALFCLKGFLDIETDGDSYHLNSLKGQEDNKRNNALTAKGWQVLRFGTHAIREEMETYCMPKIKEAIENYGGLTDIHLRKAPAYVQEPLFHLAKDFDSGALYNLEE